MFVRAFLIDVEYEFLRLSVTTDRLRTIISYDCICDMDQGTITEFDTPSALFLKDDGIFRGMCERSGITLEDIRLETKERRYRED